MAGPAIHPGTRSGASFRDVVAGSSPAAPGQVNFELGSFQGSPAVFISDEDMVSLAVPFSLTLVGKFRVARPPLDAIRIFVNRLKFAGEVMVLPHDNLHVFFRFSVGSDYNRFFVRRFFTVFGVGMKVIKWSPFFDFGDEIPIVPLWISFPELRLQLCDQSTLLFLGKAFGNPLAVDSLAAGCGKSPIARALVEVDVSKPLPDRLWIGSKESGAFQSVSFENVPPYCLRCRRFGHVGCHCPMGQAMVTFSGVLDGSAVSSNPPGPGAPSVPGFLVEDDPADQEVLGVVVPVEEGEVGIPNLVFVILPNGELSTHQEASLPIVPSTPIFDVGDCSNAFGPSPNNASSCGIPSLGTMVLGVPAPHDMLEVVGGAPLPTPVLEVVLGDVLVDGQLGTDSDLESSESVPLVDRPSFGGGVCPGFPSMGITTRSKSRACGGPTPGRGGGSNSGGKSKKKKRKNKFDYAMAVALEALFKPPDYNA